MTRKFPRSVPSPDPDLGAGLADRRLTEVSAAERFVVLHGYRLRYVHPRKEWRRFEGHRWVRDSDKEVVRLAVEFVKDWLHDVVVKPSGKARDDEMGFLLSLERHKRITDMLAIAAALLPVADDGIGWDADPMLLGVQNGTIDLRTGVLRDGQPDDRITLSTGVPFEPNLTPHRFEQFLQEVFNGNDEMVAFLWRALGYALTGSVDEQCWFLLHGAGANGKSTLLETIAHVLGDYAFTMPFATIEGGQRTSATNDLAALQARRFIMTSETSDGARLNEARLKTLTGGDQISARFLYQEFQTFRPCGKIFLGTNHKPVVKDDSLGFWRRVRLIEFERRFPINRELSSELRAEASAILSWAVRGCLAWQADRLAPPDCVLTATRDYERDSDQIADFLDECIERVDGAELTGREFYECYAGWAKQHSLTPRETLTSTGFGRKMSERFEKRKAVGGQRYLGVARLGC